MASGRRAPRGLGLSSSAMILARVRRTLRERALLTGGERVLVACSGGPDSAALLHVLHRLAPELSLELHAASVDHGLRADAARDVEVAAQLAQQLAVPFAALRVSVPAEGPSVQAKARRARYEALWAEARRAGAVRVAVGHTLDDQAETVLGRLLRGSGVLGLSGIDPHREDGVVRPLIDCRRDAVHAHVRRFGLPCVADPSNDDPAFERVRLRRSVVPALEAEDPRLVEHLAQLADDARALGELVQGAAADLLASARRGPDALEIAPLAAAPAAVRREALAAWAREIRGADAARAHVEALERALQGRGEALLAADRRVRREGAALVARYDRDAPTRSRRGPPRGGHEPE